MDNPQQKQQQSSLSHYSIASKQKKIPTPNPPDQIHSNPDIVITLKKEKGMKNEEDPTRLLQRDKRQQAALGNQPQANLAGAPDATGHVSNFDILAHLPELSNLSPIPKKANDVHNNQSEPGSSGFQFLKKSIEAKLGGSSSNPDQHRFDGLKSKGYRPSYEEDLAEDQAPKEEAKMPITSDMPMSFEEDLKADHKPVTQSQQDYDRDLLARLKAQIKESKNMVDQLVQNKEAHQEVAAINLPQLLAAQRAEISTNYRPAAAGDDKSRRSKQSQPKQGGSGSTNQISSSSSSGGSQNGGAHGANSCPPQPPPQAVSIPPDASENDALRGASSSTEKQNTLVQPTDKEPSVTIPIQPPFASTRIETSVTEPIKSGEPSFMLKNAIQDANVLPKVEVDPKKRASQTSFSRSNSARDSRPSLDPKPCDLVENNIFASFFFDVNEKAQEALQRKSPEPERALEFLKRAEDFLKKIEKLQQSYKDNEMRRLKRTLMSSTSKDSPVRLIPTVSAVVVQTKEGSHRSQVSAKLSAIHPLEKSQDSLVNMKTVSRQGESGGRMSKARDSFSGDGHVLSQVFSADGPDLFADGADFEKKVFTVHRSDHPSSLNDEIKTVSYSLREMLSTYIDPSHKIVLYYNMACCLQRLKLHEECSEYLELATVALKERLKILDQQEQSLLLNNHYLQNNNQNGTPASARSREHLSSKKGDKYQTERSRKGAATTMGTTKTGAFFGGKAEVSTKTKGQSDTVPADDELNYKNNLQYEKILAQKMQSLRYQCKLHLQICAIMSQLSRHRDALIYGKKSSMLCSQLIKDANLLCKRQISQIDRQAGRKDEVTTEDMGSGVGQMTLPNQDTNVYDEFQYSSSVNYIGDNLQPLTSTVPKKEREYGRSLTRAVQKSSQSTSKKEIKRHRSSTVHKDSSSSSNSCGPTSEELERRQQPRPQTSVDIQTPSHLNTLRKPGRTQQNSIRNHYQSDGSHKARDTPSEGGLSLGSSRSLARLKVKRAFDMHSRSSEKSIRVKKKRTDSVNSRISQLSQNSLKKTHTFALKAAQQKKQNAPDDKAKGFQPAKVYYVEEHVKVLQEVIQQADPILTELSSEINSFQKLTEKYKSAKARDTELYNRYGKEDFLQEREKLNISFENLRQIQAVQNSRRLKISVRNHLGVKQSDDWIFNLNIGNVMHLSLMGADELTPINFKLSQGLHRLKETIQESCEVKEENQFETSHELCKDAMLEKIVLISVAYFCIATEMRFVIQKQKQSKTLVKKDSEQYHAKALHIISTFLPKECPLVQHIAKSYDKNYLQEKQVAAAQAVGSTKFKMRSLGIEVSSDEEEEEKKEETRPSKIMKDNSYKDLKKQDPEPSKTESKARSKEPSSSSKKQETTPEQNLKAEVKMADGASKEISTDKKTAAFPSPMQLASAGSLRQSKQKESTIKKAMPPQTSLDTHESNQVTSSIPIEESKAAPSKPTPPVILTSIKKSKKDSRVKESSDMKSLSKDTSPWQVFSDTADDEENDVDEGPTFHHQMAQQQKSSADDRKVLGTIAKKSLNIKLLRRPLEGSSTSKGAFSKKMSAQPALGSATGGYLGGSRKLDAHQLKREQIAKKCDRSNSSLRQKAGTGLKKISTSPKVNLSTLPKSKMMAQGEVPGRKLNTAIGFRQDAPRNTESTPLMHQMSHNGLKTLKMAGQAVGTKKPVIVKKTKKQSRSPARRPQTAMNDGRRDQNEEDEGIFGMVKKFYHSRPSHQQ